MADHLSFRIGIDMVRTHRWRETPFSENKDFYSKIFTPDEISYCTFFSDPYPHFAGRFAAKEAVLKASGKNVPMIDIHVSEGPNKEPVISCPSIPGMEFQVSISHEEDIAVAVAIAARRA